MASGWSTEETRALISVWGEANVQDQLDSVKRNKDIYERISAQLSAQGWTKSWKQCRVKVKNLTQRYRKVKDNNNVSGKGRKSCPFYDEIDSILGTRAASQPVILLDSGTEQCDSGAVAKELDDQALSDFVEEQNTNEGDDSLFGFNEPEPEDGCSTCSREPSSEKNTSFLSNDSNDTCSTSPSSAGTTKHIHAKFTTVKKGTKRKRAIKEGLVKEVIKALDEIDREAEERYKEREEKRMRIFLEAEEMRRKAYAEEEEKRRQDERRHEENMQYMFLSFMQQISGGRQVGPFYDQNCMSTRGPPFAATLNFTRPPEELPYGTQCPCNERQSSP